VIQYSNPDFQINPDLDICRIIPKIPWIQYLVGIIHFAECCENRPVAIFFVESCPLTKLNGGLSRLHSADEDAVSWLTNYGK